MFMIDSLRTDKDIKSITYFHRSANTMIIAKESHLFKTCISVDIRKCDEIPLNCKKIGYFGSKIIIKKERL